jgi:hypothetical protein
MTRKNRVLDDYAALRQSCRREFRSAHGKSSSHGTEEIRPTCPIVRKRNTPAEKAMASVWTALQDLRCQISSSQTHAVSLDTMLQRRERSMLRCVSPNVAQNGRR